MEPHSGGQGPACDASDPALTGRLAGLGGDSRLVGLGLSADECGERDGWALLMFFGGGGSYLVALRHAPAQDSPNLFTFGFSHDW